jgi:hypothetical protein
MPRVIEMRTYRTKPGMRQRVIDILVERSFPVLREIGMSVLGPFPSVHDPDVFFWMRGFPDLAARERMRAEFYDGAFWNGELEPLIMPLLENHEMVLVEDPDQLLPMQSGARL